MSGVLAVIPAGEPVAAPVRDALLRALGERGRDARDSLVSGQVLLAGTRHAWECSVQGSGRRCVLDDDGLLIAADATLYHRGDLLRALGALRMPPRGATAGHLIAAAYRAWGAACPEHLEGDFAFVLWDPAVRTLLAARDLGGKRPLFHALAGGTRIVASTLGAIRALPECPGALDPGAIAMHAAGLFATPDVTPYAGIAELPAGHSLIIRHGAARVVRHWAPPPVRDARGPRFDDAADELRDLLAVCTAERLAPEGPTSIWLSGGWDSSAVLGAALHALGPATARERLRAVSISFPPGDPGREDELIEQLGAHGGVPVHWLDIGTIPLLDRPLERAARREAPFAHPFEMGNHALAAGSRDVGAHVALDGVGGDQLFQVSEVYLADLLRTGRLVALARACRRAGLHRASAAQLLQTIVQPLLPGPLLHLARLARGGRPLRGYLERRLPEWFDPGFARRHALEEREAAAVPPRAGRDRAAHEMHWYLGYAFFPRAFAAVADIALAHGVELRSPLYDRRIVEFAAGRPREERAGGGETKRLLRRAMRGVLPESFLAPRVRRTGTAGAYFARELRRTHAPWLTAALAEPLHLEALGIVRGATLRRCWADFVGGRDRGLGMPLLLTIQAELWLRTHVEPSAPPDLHAQHRSAAAASAPTTPRHGDAVPQTGLATRALAP